MKIKIDSIFGRMILNGLAVAAALLPSGSPTLRELVCACDATYNNDPADHFYLTYHVSYNTSQFQNCAGMGFPHQTKLGPNPVTLHSCRYISLNPDGTMPDWASLAHTNEMD